MRNLFRTGIYTLVFAVLSLVFLNSCNSEQLLQLDELPLKEKVEFVNNPYVIDEGAAIAAGSQFIGELDGIVVKSGNVTLRSSVRTNTEKASVSVRNYNVKIAELSSKEKAVKQVIPVYTINYKDLSEESDGYVIVAGDERIEGDNVILFSEVGAFDLSQRGDDDFIDDLISGFLYNQINRIEDESKVSTRGYSIVDYGDSYQYTISMFPQFNQIGAPFNNYTPFRSGVRAKAGSEAVAVSQVIAHNQWPLQGAFKRYTTNTPSPEIVTFVSYQLTSTQWSDLRSNNVPYWIANSTTIVQYVANLITDVGYKLNTNYGSSQSKALPNNIPAVLTQMGFTSSPFKAYSLADIQYDIDVEGIPLIMSGTSNMSDPYYNNSSVSTYTYSVLGTYYRNYNTASKPRNIYIKLFHSDNGDYAFTLPSGYGQTWFNSLLFTSSNTTPPYNPTLNGDDVYPYRYSCNIISSIKPNPSNPGCTNPAWTITPVTNPY